VAGVVVAVAVVLLIVVVVGWAVLMVRVARSQRARGSRTNFGGRYTDFGFVFGIFDRAGRAEPRRRDHRTRHSDVDAVQDSDRSDNAATPAR
jgi:hypothetical protein